MWAGGLHGSRWWSRGICWNVVRIPSFNALGREGSGGAGKYAKCRVLRSKVNLRMTVHLSRGAGWWYYQAGRTYKKYPWHVVGTNSQARDWILHRGDYIAFSWICIYFVTYIRMKIFSLKRFLVRKVGIGYWYFSWLEMNMPTYIIQFLFKVYFLDIFGFWNQHMGSTYHVIFRLTVDLPRVFNLI